MNTADRIDALLAEWCDTDDRDKRDEIAGEIKKLAALAPPSGEGVEYVDADDVFLSQGTDDVPCLQVPGRILASFVPGSWDRVYSLFSGNTPTPQSAGTPSGGVLISHDELKAWRELVDISPSQVQLEISAMLSATPQSAPEE